MELQAKTNCCFKATIAVPHHVIFPVHPTPPSSLSKPSEPRNGPPPGTVYFAPDTGSYRADPPCVHLPVASIEILIHHPSGPDWSRPSGGCSPVTINEGRFTREGGVRGRAGRCRKGEGKDGRECWEARS